MGDKMAIKIRGKGKNKLRLEFEEEGHSLINLLRQNLWDSDTNIDKAEYRKGHTYLDNFELQVKTESGDPVEALKNAAEQVKEDCEEFEEKLEKAV